MSDDSEESTPESCLILGSGTSTGVPVIGCQCAICSSGDPIHQRSRCSVAITTAKQRKIIIDTGPDFRMQCLSHKVSRPDAVVYTHLHADHSHGFDDLRAFGFHNKTPIPCYLAAHDLKELRHRFSYAFETTSYQGARPIVELLPLPDRGEVDVAGQKMDVQTFDHGGPTTLGFRMGRFAYITDFKSIDRHVIARWHGRIHTAVMSGIHYGDHRTHSTIPETIEWAKRLGVERLILTHLSHEVDARDRSRLPSFAEFAGDGMLIDLASTHLSKGVRI